MYIIRVQKYKKKSKFISLDEKNITHGAKKTFTAAPY